MDAGVTFSSFASSLPIPLLPAVAFLCRPVFDHLSWHSQRRGARCAPVRRGRIGGPQLGVLSLTSLTCTMKRFVFRQGKRAAKLKPDALNLPCRVFSSLSCSGVVLCRVRLVLPLPRMAPFYRKAKGKSLAIPCLCGSTESLRGHPTMSPAPLKQTESFCCSEDLVQPLTRDKAQNEESCAYPSYQSQVQHCKLVHPSRNTT